MKRFRSKLVALSVGSLMVASAVAVVADEAGERADVAGEWEITQETDADTMKSKFILAQEEATVTGTYTDEFGTVPVTGTVNGNGISLQFRAEIPDENLIVIYIGTIEGGSMTGQVTFGDLGEGSFTGHKL